VDDDEETFTVAGVRRTAPGTPNRVGQRTTATADTRTDAVPVEGKSTANIATTAAPTKTLRIAPTILGPFDFSPRNQSP
jgi:hypothetical protein